MEKKKTGEAEGNILHECLVHPAVIAHGSVKEALVIGGTDGAAAGELLKYKDLRRVLIVGSDGGAAGVRKKRPNKNHQGVFDNPRTRLLTVNAQKFIETIEQKFDLIIYNPPAQLKSKADSKVYTASFFKKLKRRMRHEAVFVLRAGSVNKAQTKFYRVLCGRLKNVFKYCFPFYMEMTSNESRQIFLLCSNCRDTVNIRQKQIISKIKNSLSGQVSIRI